MPIPNYETLMLPILRFLSDDSVKKTREIVKHAIGEFNITAEEAKQLIPSGRAKLIDNRVGWACTYLRRHGLISSPQRGQNTITKDGLELLSKNPERIDNNLLKQLYPCESDAEEGQTETPVSKSDWIAAEKTPEEIIGTQNQIVHEALASDLLDHVSQVEPDQFERIVVDLLLAMGYGGTVEDAGSAIGRSNDGGIDGVIKEDVLGLETIYIQAKRWQGSIPIKEIRDFAGALLSMRAHKGVFITTSSFSSNAYEFVSSIDRKIVLIDGKRLAQLMIKFNLGVSIKQRIELKEIDVDYFTL